MKIKKLTLNDKEQLNILIGKIEENLEKEDYWLPINEPSREHFFDEQWTEFYGMFDGDELIAAAALFYNEHEYGESVQVIGLECDRVAEIGRAMVAPSYRGNNYLYELNSVLIDVARSKGIECLVATIHPDNIPSQRSFKKIGFTRKGTYTKSCGFTRDVFTLPLK